MVMIQDVSRCRHAYCTRFIVDRACTSFACGRTLTYVDLLRHTQAVSNNLEHATLHRRNLVILHGAVFVVDAFPFMFAKVHKEYKEDAGTDADGSASLPWEKLSGVQKLGFIRVAFSELDAVFLHRASIITKPTTPWSEMNVDEKADFLSLDRSASHAPQNASKQSSLRVFLGARVCWGFVPSLRKSVFETDFLDIS